MSRPDSVLARIRTVLAVVWRHASAGIAVLLILLALWLGYAIGRPAPEPAPEAATTASPDDAAPTLYTCSMHPSVRLPDPDAKCPICFMDLIPVAGDDGPGSERRISIDAEAAVRARVETVAVARLLPEAEVRLYGRLQPDETRVARLTAWFPGRIERLFVNYVGVPVRRGDHLAELYSPELVTALAELRQAAAAVDAGDDEGASGGSRLVRESSVRTLEAARERLRLLGVTDEQVAAAEADTLDGDRLEVYAPLGGVVTHLAAREGDYLDTGEPIATVADLTRLWLDLEAFESQLPMLRWGQSVRFRVEARPGETFEGRISFIEPMVDERTRTAAVRVSVPNPDGRLKPGMFASATVRPRVAADGAVVSDELAGRWVGPMHPTVVKDAPGTCDVCGMDLVPAESLGVVGDPSAVEVPLVVPTSAVLFTGVRSVVYVEVPGTERPTYESRDVVLGPRAGDLHVVRAGLAEGERVVVRGAFRIDSEMQIAAKPSMMSSRNEAAGAASRTDVPEAFVHGLKPVYAAYLDAQEALARDDLAGFERARRDLVTYLELAPTTGVVGPPLAAYRRAAAQLRVRESFATIEAARARFESMSDGAIDLLRRFGHHGAETWHVGFCPMAFDDRGADWVQRGTVIWNPYFGDAMLRCGEIREPFVPLGAAEGDGDD